MRTYLILGLAAIVALGGCVSVKGTANMYKVSEQQGMVRHVVLFKFKDGTTPAQVADIEKRFGDLKNQIPEIKDYEWGTNVSPEKHSEGFTHAFVLTFANEKDRDAYLPSAPHQEFAKSLGPYLDKVLVIDFIVRK